MIISVITLSTTTKLSDPVIAQSSTIKISYFIQKALLLKKLCVYLCAKKVIKTVLLILQRSI